MAGQCIRWGLQIRMMENIMKSIKKQGLKEYDPSRGISRGLHSLRGYSLAAFHQSKKDCLENYRVGKWWKPKSAP